MADKRESAPGLGVPVLMRDEHTAERRAIALLDTLERRWRHWFAGAENEDFSQWFVWPLWDGSFFPTDPDHIALYGLSDQGREEFGLVPNNNVPNGDEIRAMCAATAYCVQAIKEHRAGNTSAAWDYAFDGAAWEGYLAGRSGVSLQDRQAGASEIQRKNAKKRNQDARDWIRGQWMLERADYNYRKLPFSQIYAKRLVNEGRVKTKSGKFNHRTISERWLSDL